MSTREERLQYDWKDLAPCPNCGMETKEMTDAGGSALCVNANCRVEMYNPYQ